MANVDGNLPKSNPKVACFPTSFVWTLPCKTVSISGSFNNWGQCIEMTKQEDSSENISIHAITLDLPVGTHTYKYLVDGEWKYDPESAFAQDEYGNLNNFIIVAASSTTDPQRPLKTMLRDQNRNHPVINPVASASANEVTRRGVPVPTFKSCCSLPPSPKSHSKEDPEYGLHVHPRPRGSSLTGSDHLLSQTLGRLSMGKNDRTKESINNANILLSARTQHFGGDLVTEEHMARQRSGGHRSIVTTPNAHSLDEKSGKLLIFLVGLPGRGKTYMGNLLCRHLTWMGNRTKIFNVGNYRRETVGSDVPHSFWDPKNKDMYEVRNQIARKCLLDALNSLEQEDCDCAIYDATNATVERRRDLIQDTKLRANHQIVFIESICDDPTILESAMHEMKLNSADYKNKTLAEASKDYFQRIQHYSNIYDTLSESEGVSFIKVINVGRQIFCNQINGYLQSRILCLMANVHIQPRPIWLSRHGESVYNTQEKIGGDSPLSPLGLKFAEQLDSFIDAYYPKGTELSVWTSTMCRTGMTVERIAKRGRQIVKWKQLDEIDAGICDGMTYEQVASEMPEEYLMRKQHKLHYRYPRGESYQDVIHRLEPVITELLRQRGPVLIVAHQAVLRVLYAYLTHKMPEDCPTLNIPLHTVIQLTPKAYRCEEVWHQPM